MEDVTRFLIILLNVVTMLATVTFLIKNIQNARLQILVLLEMESVTKAI